MNRLQTLAGHLLDSATPPSAVVAVHTSGEAKSDPSKAKHGGQLAAQALIEQGVKYVFTLTGGHIAPILVGANQAGLRVVDVRDEVTTVFAADAVSRISGIPGVAIVTAGPGLTNTITAVKNAQMAQSAVIVMAGATSMLLKGRGSLQDIDQLALMRPHTKWMVTIKSVSQIIPAIRNAFRIAQEGVPGPVFIEFPLEVLWPEETTAEALRVDLTPAKFSIKLSDLNKRAIMEKVQQVYLQRHMHSVFKDAWVRPAPLASVFVPVKAPVNSDLAATARALASAKRPLILVGSQAMRAREVPSLVTALDRFGVPLYLSGMARGLMGKEHRLHMKHKRGVALAKADFVLLAGVPMDFRLNYGRDINKGAFLGIVNLDTELLVKNKDIRGSDVRANCDPLSFLVRLADMTQSGAPAKWADWFKLLNEQQVKREVEITKMASEQLKDKSAKESCVNPLRLCQAIDRAISDDAVMIADGGDFVGTASYILRPRGPLSWLDPGVFGTLGVGAGFALGAKLLRPQSEVWAIYGDGSVGWSLAEFDTFVRHKIPVIAVVGNDACWMQMYRDQVRMLKDAVACELNFTNYEQVVKGLGAEGILVREESEIEAALEKAKKFAREGKPVLVNVMIARSAFREGSISL